MKKHSIMFWVVLTLVVVGATPFMLSWYQIEQSQQAIIDQAQKNHLIVSRATADRIDTYIDGYQDLLSNLANNADVYIAPDADAASQALKNSLISQPEVIVIALMLVQENGQRSVIQLASKNEQLNLSELPVNEHHDHQPKMIESTSGKLLQLSIPSARPKVDVVMWVQVDIQQLLDPQILGQTANISVYNQQGQLLEFAGNQAATVPEEWGNLFQNETVTGGANRAQQTNIKAISAFAKLEDLPWFVVSEQPVEFAEQSASDMKRTAWQVFGLVLMVMTAITTLAYLSWVKPIRRIIKAQNQIMGEQPNASLWSGGEMAALEHSFDALTKHIDDRNALGKIFVDRYQVMSPIGTGGMGSVFLGWDPKLKRHVALKTLPLDKKNAFDSRKNMSETLVQEAITAAKISHRNVVSIYDVVSTKKTAFIAMEYIKGESLFDLLCRSRTLSLNYTLAIAVAVLKGLHSAHKMGFVHRDIKPGNVLLDINGDIKLTDFGTTALIHTLTHDAITGTPSYMAPETHQSGIISIQSDLFAVGVVIAECLLGENPFHQNKLSQTRDKIINHQVVFPPKLMDTGPKGVFEVINKLLNKDPSQRPASAAKAAHSLVRQMTEQIHWDASIVGVQIHKKENNYENTKTLVALS